MAAIPSAGSSGRRNGLGEDLIWFPPAEGLSRACVELAGDGVEIPLRVAGEIGPLREVLAEQPVGVLARGTLPGAAGVEEIDGDAGLDAEADVLGHLFALIPRERTPELRRQRGHPLSERPPHVLGRAALGQAQEQHVAAAPLDHATDRGAPRLAEEQVTFPMPGHRAVRRLGRACGDQDHVDPPPRAYRAGLRATLGAAGAEACRELSAEGAPGLDE